MAHPSAERVRSIARLLRAVPLPRARARRGKVPRQAQPDHIRKAYWHAILPVCEQARAAFLVELPAIARDHERWLRETKRKDARADAVSPLGAARVAVDRAAKRFADAFRPQEVHEVARQFGERTSEFQKVQLDRQVRAAVGVPYSAIERPTRDRVEGWAALNVDLIRTVPDRYFDRLRSDVEEAYSTGMSTDDLVDRFTEDYGIQERDAERIARDQVGKLNGQVNQDRQESLGVTKFRWRTMNDQRVREEHADLEGEEFDWEDPPLDPITGEQMTPGSPIQCRCYAEPVFDDLLE